MTAHRDHADSSSILTTILSLTSAPPRARRRSPSGYCALCSTTQRRVKRFLEAPRPYGELSRLIKIAGEDSRSWANVFTRSRGSENVEHTPSRILFAIKYPTFGVRPYAAAAAAVHIFWRAYVSRRVLLVLSHSMTD